MKNHPDFDKIWYTTVYLEVGNSHVTKYDFFFKFKVADTRHIKNLILAITQQSIARLQWNSASGSSFSQNFGNETDTRALWTSFS